MNFMCRTVAVIGCSIFLVACGTDFHSSIPDVRFNFTCSLVQAEYSSLKIPGEFIKVVRNANNIPVGYGGLIIGQSIYSEGHDFVAYDAACPVEADRRYTLEIKDEGVKKGICPECGTVYDLSNGGYPNRKGGEYLKRYNVIVNGTTLTVRN